MTNKIREIAEIKARIDELERAYDERGGATNPANDVLLIQRATLRWVLGYAGGIEHKGMW